MSQPREIYPIELNEMSCCGMREIGNLSDHDTAEQMMKAFVYAIWPAKIHYHNDNDKKDRIDNVNEMSEEDARFRYVVFSQARANSTYGNRFAAFIQKHNLGQVVETGTHVNPNTDNPLKAFMWTVDWDQVRTWREEHAPTKLVKEKQYRGYRYPWW